MARPDALSGDILKGGTHSQLDWPVCPDALGSNLLERDAQLRATNSTGEEAVRARDGHQLLLLQTNDQSVEYPCMRCAFRELGSAAMRAQEATPHRHVSGRAGFLYPVNGRTAGSVPSAL